MQPQMVSHGDDRFGQVAESRVKLPSEYYDLSTPSRRLNTHLIGLGKMNAVC
jgi:hypothetical protein